MTSLLNKWKHGSYILFIWLCEISAGKFCYPLFFQGSGISLGHVETVTNNSNMIEGHVIQMLGLRLDSLSSKSWAWLAIF